jgi:hypothetical protein
MLPEDLEDWLVNNGVAVVQKRASGSPLSPREQLLYEVWLVYMETMNGGLSQYFCNEGWAHWERCVATAANTGLRSFAPFATRVNALIDGAKDPYEALIRAGDVADETYYQHETEIVTELRAIFVDATDN